ncbi:MAG: hypothetical protein Q9223_001926 [Gallowayella weberi]
MGASSSKAARSVASASGHRKFPSRTPETNPTANASSAPPPPAGQPTAPGPTVHPQTQAAGSRDESINLDASDPDFARSLRSLGPILSRRSELANEAEAEFTRLRGGGEGRKYLDVVKIKEVLTLRDGRGMPEAEIEERLGLRKGVVGRLGAKGVLSEAGLGEEKEEEKDAGPL